MKSEAAIALIGLLVSLTAAGIAFLAVLLAIHARDEYIASKREISVTGTFSEEEANT